MELLFCDFCGRFKTKDDIRLSQFRLRDPDGPDTILSANICDRCASELLKRFDTQAKPDFSTIPNSLK